MNNHELIQRGVMGTVRVILAVVLLVLAAGCSVAGSRGSTLVGYSYRFPYGDGDEQYMLFAEPLQYEGLSLLALRKILVDERTVVIGDDGKTRMRPEQVSSLYPSYLEVGAPAQVTFTVDGDTLHATRIEPTSDFGTARELDGWPKTLGSTQEVRGQLVGASSDGSDYYLLDVFSTELQFEDGVPVRYGFTPRLPVDTQADAGATTEDAVDELVGQEIIATLEATAPATIMDVRGLGFSNNDPF